MKKFKSIISLTLGACMSVSAFSGCNFLEDLMRKPLSGEEAQKAYEEIVEAIDFTKNYTGAATIDSKVSMDINTTPAGPHEEKYDEKISFDPATSRVYFKNNVGSDSRKGKLYKIGEDYYFHANSNYDERPEEFRYASMDEAFIGEELRRQNSEKFSLTIDMGLEKTNAIWEDLFAEAKVAVYEQAEDPNSKYYGVTHADGKVEYSIEKAGSAYFLKLEEYAILNRESAETERKIEYKYAVEIKVEDGKVVGYENTLTEVQKIKDERGEHTAKDHYSLEETYSYKFNESEYNLMKLSVEKDGEKRSFAKGEDVLDFYGKENVQQPEYQYSGMKDLSVNGGVIGRYYVYGNTVEEFFDSQTEGLDENLNYAWYADESCTQALETVEQFAKAPVIYAVATPKDGYALVNKTYHFDAADDLGAKEKTLMEILLSSLVAANNWVIDLYEIRGCTSKAAGESYVMETILSDVDVSCKLDGVEKQQGDTFIVESGKTYEVEYNIRITKEWLNDYLREFTIFDVLAVS